MGLKFLTHLIVIGVSELAEAASCLLCLFRRYMAIEDLFNIGEIGGLFIITLTGKVADDVLYNLFLFIL